MPPVVNPHSIYSNPISQPAAPPVLSPFPSQAANNPPPGVLGVEPDARTPLIYLVGALAVLLGICTVPLFWNVSGLGLNLVLSTLLILGAGGALVRAIRGALPYRMLALMGASVCFAAFYTWRNASMLNLLNLFLVFLLGALALSPNFARATHWTFARVGLALKQSLASVLAGGYHLLREFPWHTFSFVLNLSAIRVVIRGLLLALPLLIIFGLLFQSADQRFAALLQNSISWVFNNIGTQAIWFAVGTLITGGLLRMAGFGVATASDYKAPRQSLWVGATEAAICIGILNLLFLAFVSLQLPYLFGGMRHVLDAPGLTLAEYARRGFFELAIVATLVLPMLLVADWLLSPESTPRQVAAFRIACGVLLVLLALIMASALQRMVIYMQQFGLTQLRLFVSAFIVMLAAVFVWFAWTVLRGRRQRFLGGAILIGCGFAAMLQLLNPDAHIASYNLQRARAGHSCDFKYLAELSTDALPAIARELEQGAIPNSHQLIEQLQEHHVWQAYQPWQSWNYSRAHGRKVLGELLQKHK